MARASDPAQALAGATWVVQTLVAAGHTAYFAGGCVRDALLGLHPTDFDIATSATPDRVRALFPRSDLVGASFGVVLVHIPKAHLPADNTLAGSAPGPSNASPRVSVEVATFRSDGPYSDARRPDSVVFSDPIADAQRRDFTINALFLDPLAPGAVGALSGQVIDHVGGLEDLRRGLIRAVGDPEQRLREDHLRALRAVRFAARLGFSIDPATARAISAHAGDLRGVSRERIGEEIRRMLAHPNREQAVTLIEQLGLDAPVLNEPASTHIRRPSRLLRCLPNDADVCTSLAAWILDRAWVNTAPTWLDVTHRRGQASPLAHIRSALCLSNDEFDALERTLELARQLALHWPTARVARKKRWTIQDEFAAALGLVCCWSAEVAVGISRALSALSEDGVGIDPVPLITGDDLVAEGFTPSPKFKLALETVYDAQLEGALTTKSAAMELARTLCV